jgi:hypothetical protein
MKPSDARSLDNIEDGTVDDQRLLAAAKADDGDWITFGRVAASVAAPIKRLTVRLCGLVNPCHQRLEFHPKPAV